MTGRDAARDELADDIDAVLSARMNRPDSIQSWDMDEDLYPIAEALLARGYRRSVTPDEIERAAQTLAYRARATWEGSEDYWRFVAGELIRAFGLEVTE